MKPILRLCHAFDDSTTSVETVSQIHIYACRSIRLEISSFRNELCNHSGVLQVILSLRVIVQLLAVLYMLRSHQNNCYPILRQKLIQVEPVVPCGFQSNHDSPQPCRTALALIPRFKTGKSCRRVAEAESLFAELHASVIEGSGPVPFTSDVDSDHHGIVCDLCNLLILGIIHFGYLLYCRLANFAGQLVYFTMGYLLSQFAAFLAVSLYYTGSCYPQYCCQFHKR